MWTSNVNVNGSFFWMWMWKGAFILNVNVNGCFFLNVVWTCNVNVKGCSLLISHCIYIIVGLCSRRRLSWASVAMSSASEESYQGTANAHLSHLKNYFLKLSVSHLCWWSLTSLCHIWRHWRRGRIWWIQWRQVRYFLHCWLLEYIVFFFLLFFHDLLCPWKPILNLAYSWQPVLSMYFSFVSLPKKKSI